uniref:Uncharacterized protein n=1 Tax=viral metagenome TaxID=1070528 RepID=A0A6C0HLK4_9ZZZZ
MQSPGKQQLQPGVSAIQRKYIDSFLNYVILRLLGLLSDEDKAALGDSLDMDAFLARVRGIVEMFTPYIFILDTLSSPDRRSGGLVDILVHSAKQTIQWAGREAPHVGSVLGFGVGGELIGWAIALPFWVVGAAVGVSSKDPKFTLKSVAGMIPVIATDIQNTIDAVDSTATRVANKTASIAEGLKSAANAVAERSAYLKTSLQPSIPIQ